MVRRVIYIYAAVAIAFFALAGYAKIQHSGKLEAQAQVEARDATIRQQNAAVQQLKVDGDRRVAAATKGVQAASKATQRARSEAERLRVLAGQPAKPGACAAADAVSEVRRGL